MNYLIKYRHYDCKINPNIEWEDEWSCACNGECPACGIDDIEPVDWVDLDAIARSMPDEYPMGMAKALARKQLNE